MPRLRAKQETARTEREALTQHVRATEDRAHAEVDRARQDAKDTRQQLAALQKETDASAHRRTVALEHAAPVAADLREQLAAQQARADALDAQLLHLRDLPATLEAAWRKHEQEAKPLAATKAVRVRKRRTGS
jgi:predicted  nucleic acid-binding Zn-ribbon protein